jgi:hypothetical protein
MPVNGCLKFEELMARYVHGEILRHEREALECHLGDCPGCNALYHDVTEADRLVRSLPPAGIEPPPWLHARIMANLPESPKARLFARWGSWAWSLAATSAGAILAVLLMRGGQSHEPVRVAAVSPHTVSAPAAEPAAKIPEAARAPVAPPARANGEAQAGPAAVEPLVVASVPEASPAPEVKIIREIKIYLYAPAAQRVAVTGDFNGWDAKGVELKPAGRPGMWETDLQLSPGAYAYNFIVDGDVLVPDPEAPNQMPDGFGGTNSILLVKEGAPT